MRVERDEILHRITTINSSTEIQQLDRRECIYKGRGLTSANEDLVKLWVVPVKEIQPSKFASG